MRGAARTFLLAVVIASGCRAQSAQEGTQATRSLASFGARGDGRTDDTSALKRALEASNRYCLDGGGRSYRVTGTLRAAKDLCLRNLTLVQAALPMNAGAYVLRRCPSVQDPSAAIDCGDPPVPAAQFGRLWDSLSIRTLLIRPGRSKPLRVSLDHVKRVRPEAQGRGGRSREGRSGFPSGRRIAGGFCGNLAGRRRSRGLPERGDHRRRQGLWLVH